MARRDLTKPPALRDSWTWTVGLDGDAEQCWFEICRDDLRLLSGTIAAADGATTAELHDRRMGETPHDVAELHAAWLWALEQARELMLAEGGSVDWQPHPDPRNGMGSAP